MAQTTHTPDTVAAAVADTVAAAVPRDLHMCHECDAPVSAREMRLYSSAAPAWQSGIEGGARPFSVAGDSGVLTLVTICFVLLTLNHRNCMRLLRSFADIITKPRRRSNALDDNTANESRTELLMLFQTCVLEAILLYVAIGTPHAGGPALLYVGVLTGVTVAYYIFQAVAYMTVGYVFAPRGYTAPLLRSFNATQSVMGMALLVPALATLFYPAMATAMMFSSAALYVIARILFIRVGFRIFYHNFSSLLYFFLYLCTLEMIPLVVVFRTAVSLSNIL